MSIKPGATIKPAGVDFFDFGFRDRGLRKRSDNLSIDDQKVGDFVALVRRIDDAAVANDQRVHVAIPPQR